ncbi:MAG: hypothetical protein D6B25_04985 [Desulfobulbaceae bacterium]|nr:MAG: hypothetical protein D6B25_04985 [Desulfobulbaceae bacterium]
MSRAKHFEKALEALRLLNQAVTTSRLYPAVSPQVTNAVEKAFKSAQELGAEYGDLAFGRVDGKPHLWGEEPASEEKQALFELVIYRHLDLLGVDHFTLKPDFDRILFKKILIVFVSRKEKINREGGGRQFITNLELQDYFPETYEPPTEPSKTRPAVVPSSAEKPVDPAGKLVDFLSTDQPGEQPPDEIVSKLAEDQFAIETLVSGIKRLTTRFTNEKNERTGSSLVLSSSYTRFVNGFGDYLASDKHEPLTNSALQTIFPKADAFTLCLLLVQRYGSGFGTTLFKGLCDGCPVELFGDTIKLFREFAAAFKADGKENQPQAKLISNTLTTLLKTKAGKQIVGRERAQALLETSEEDRKSKRLQAGVKALLEGDTSSLRSEEIVFKLPSTIEELIQEGDQANALRIIERASAEMLGGDDELRSRLIQSLILIGENLLRLKHWLLLDKLSGALISWVRESDEGDFVYEKSASLLQEMMKHAWQNNDYQRGDQILSVFHKIRTTQLPKSPPVVALIGRIQDRSSDQTQLESLLATYLKGEGKGKSGERLSMLGRPAGNFLIDRLVENEESEERMKIIDLLVKMGPVVSPVLLQRLQESMPWYGTRNLIKLITGLVEPKHIDAVMPFLKHQDLRVQREAFICIHTIGKAQRREVMLRCLDEVSETLLPQMLKALQPFNDAEVAERVGALLVRQEQLADRVREDLVTQVLILLQRSESASAREALKTFLEHKNRPANAIFGEHVWQKVTHILGQFQDTEPEIEGGIELVVNPEAALSPIAPDPVTPKAITPEPVAPKVVTPPKKEEKKQDYSRLPGSSTVIELLDKGELELAKEQIMAIIARAARQRQFPIAEMYREWLMDIDSMALSQIIRAAEIIEEEKVASIDSYDAETWSELYDELSTEEFATLYHSMLRKTYKNEELIVKQGSMQSRLYFISSGKVKLFYEDENGGNVLVKIVNAGEIIGAETMFDASVWTVSAGCISQAEIMMLDLKMLTKWREDMPSLESKLSVFCMSRQSLEQFFKQTGKDRRASKRHKVSGRVNNVLLSSEGEETGITSRGDLFDISLGGVSFYLRISQKSNARLLLGRNTKIVIATEGGVTKQTAIRGRIIAVRGHQIMENEYSVHVKFDQDLEASELKSIIKACSNSK